MNYSQRMCCGCGCGLTVGSIGIGATIRNVRTHQGIQLSPICGILYISSEFGTVFQKNIYREANWVDNLLKCQLPSLTVLAWERCKYVKKSIKQLNN